MNGQPNLPSSPRATNITVGILTFKRPEYLRVAIESVLQQTVLPQELLIIDDGSPERSDELVASYAARHPGLIRYVWRENGGHSPARNTAVAEMRTEYLVWLDDDDALTPTAIESHAAAAAAHPEADVIYGALMLCDDKLIPITQMASHRLDGPNKLHLFFKHNPVPNPGTLTRATLFERVGPFDSTFKHAEDYDFWTRAGSLGATFHFNDHVVCLYRSHPGNLATAEKAKRAAHERVWVVERFLSRHPVEEIFAHLDWQSHPQESLLRVCFEIAELLCRFGGHESAIEALEQTRGIGNQELLGALKHLIAVAHTDGIQAVEALLTEPAMRGEWAQRIVTALLEYHCTEIERDAFHIRQWNRDLKGATLQSILPHLPWESSPQQAAASAHATLASCYALHGGFAEALGLLRREESGIPAASVAEIASLFDEFEKVGRLDSPRWRERTDPLLLQFLQILNLRTQRYLASGNTPPISASSETPSGQSTPRPTVLTRSLPLLREAASGSFPATGALNTVRPHSVQFRSSPTPMPVITVVVPTFNRVELVDDAVQSALLQPVSELEVIVVNDAGAEIPTAYTDAWKRSGRVTLVTHVTNCGLGASRNTGISLAAGQYVLVLDDDDTLVAGATVLLLDALARCKSPFLTGDHLRAHYEEGASTPAKCTYHRRQTELDSVLGFENGIVSGSAIVAKSLLEKVGGYREDLDVHEDYNLHLRLAMEHSPEHLPAPIMTYHLRKSVGRMNQERRLYWFATAALNHQIALRLFPDHPELRSQQREAQYAHISRALSEGADPEHAAALVAHQLELLGSSADSSELEAQVSLLQQRCAALTQPIQEYIKQLRAEEGRPVG